MAWLLPVSCFARFDAAAGNSCCWETLVPCLAPGKPPGPEWAPVDDQGTSSLSKQEMHACAGSQFAPYSRRRPSKYEHLHRDDIAHHAIGRHHKNGNRLQLNRKVDVFVYEKRAFSANFSFRSKPPTQTTTREFACLAPTSNAIAPSS